MSRWPVRWRSLATILFVVALISPLVGSRDGFPLSTYPMYAAPRPAETAFVVAHGVSIGGGEVRLSTAVVADTRDPLIAEAFLRDAVGDGRAVAICSAIAERADRRSVVGIEIRSRLYRLDPGAADRQILLDDRLITSCDLPS